VFHAGELVVCVTNSRHFQGPRVAEFITRHRPRFEGKSIVIRKLREGQTIPGALEAIANATPTSSAAVCGRVETREQALARWRERTGREDDGESLVIPAGPRPEIEDEDVF
jgi:hypothetical protein